MKINKPILIQKFGGATLASSEKIIHAAQRISEQSKTHQMIVAVSAMGKTTNQLLDLASQVSKQPLQRELDMLLSVGERISMSLLSMALNDLGCAAISFTGSQAGILTSDSHINAFITDLKPLRIEEALHQNKVVIVAGFQGVCPQTKEVTTLGRGGTDTTAVAMAAHFKAERCEILKDVPGVFTADPSLIPQARPLHHISYEAMLDMTFWGAKVLHYRSVELAKTQNVKIYIGPARGSEKQGTLIQEGSHMLESSQILSLNSHETVLKISITAENSSLALQKLHDELSSHQISFPQVLSIKNNKTDFTFLITGPIENMQAIQNRLSAQLNLKIDADIFSTVTATCTGSTSFEILQKILNKTSSHGIFVHDYMNSAMSLTLLVSQKNRQSLLTHLHELIETNS